ncbi:hypothetical protein KQX54_021365 [Cotesia glomerata]|uniref:Uncharacterized protein n=1 Tax=Cotesia glomerata TaxID=32391 RepID=A0AAV7JA38_COTGL|nr:hypothetical protein KQX54_021365 [Cotesia glomerata]
MPKRRSQIIPLVLGPLLLVSPCSRNFPEGLPLATPPEEGVVCMPATRSAYREHLSNTHEALRLQATHDGDLTPLTLTHTLIDHTPLLKLKLKTRPSCPTIATAKMSNITRSNISVRRRSSNRLAVRPPARLNLRDNGAIFHAVAKSVVPEWIFEPPLYRGAKPTFDKSEAR